MPGLFFAFHLMLDFIHFIRRSAFLGLSMVEISGAFFDVLTDFRLP